MEPTLHISKQNLVKHIESAAIDELADKYTNLGYQVSPYSSPIGDDQIKADLVAKKDNEMIIFEVKTGKLAPHKKEQIKQLRKLSQRIDHAQFRLIFVSPPKDKTIEFTGLEQLLLQHFNESGESYELIELLDQFKIGSYTVKEINEIELEQIAIRDQGFEVSGDAFMDVVFRLESEHDMLEYPFTETFPFTFHILVDMQLHIKEILSIQIDVTSYIRYDDQE